MLVTTITYIPIQCSWLYLASVYNPTTRRVIAYNIGSEMTQELATAPIKTILKHANRPVIIHSDMGSQYTSDLFEITLTEAGIDQYIRWYNQERISLVA